jgi:hypothetical protein
VIDAWYRFPALRLGAVVAVAAVAGLLVWVLVLRDDEGGGEMATIGQPVAASEAELAELAGELGHPVYWIGPQDGTELEVTRLEDDRVYVRYLDEGVGLGDPRPEFTTVGTYPTKRALPTLQRAAEQEGAIVESTGDGGFVVTNETAPNSVYIAYPDQEDLQVEVYDPDPERALEIATSGAVQPID